MPRPQLAPEALWLTPAQATSTGSAGMARQPSGGMMPWATPGQPWPMPWATWLPEAPWPSWARARTSTSATIASQVRDTGTAGARWDALFWDETLPTDNTDITFEVRASDTLFAADNATLAWTPVGGTSPVTSGLPFGSIHAVAGHSDHLGYRGDAVS